MHSSLPFGSSTALRHVCSIRRCSCRDSKFMWFDACTMWYQMSAWYISVYLLQHQMQVGTYCITLLTSLADSSSLQLNCVQYFSISCFHRLYLAQWCPGTWIAWSHFRALELNPRWDALHDLLRFRYAKDATLVISSCHDRTWGFHRFSTQEIVNLLSAGILGCQECGSGLETLWVQN